MKNTSAKQTSSRQTPSGELKVYLQGTLHELGKLAEQIKETKDYSDQAELILCLRELVSEQIEVPTCENTRHSAHSVR